MNVKVIGKCSLCGGRVVVPAVIWSVVPPKPTCERCGAVADETANLPTIPMIPRRRARRYRMQFGGTTDIVGISNVR